MQYLLAVFGKSNVLNVEHQQDYVTNKKQSKPGTNGRDNPKLNCMIASRVSDSATTNGGISPTVSNGRRVSRSEISERQGITERRAVSGKQNEERFFKMSFPRRIGKGVKGEWVGASRACRH